MGGIEILSLARFRGCTVCNNDTKGCSENAFIACAGGCILMNHALSSISDK